MQDISVDGVCVCVAANILRGKVKRLVYFSVLPSQLETLNERKIQTHARTVHFEWCSVVAIVAWCVPFDATYCLKSIVTYDGLCTVYVHISCLMLIARCSLLPVMLGKAMRRVD